MQAKGIGSTGIYKGFLKAKGAVLEVIKTSKGAAPFL